MQWMRVTEIGPDTYFIFFKPLGKAQPWDNEGRTLSSLRQGSQPRMLKLGI